MRLDHGELFDYRVDERKKKVVAILTAPQDVVCKEFFNIVNKATGNRFLLTGMLPNDSMMLKGKYIGVAKCHDEDYFNVDKGLEMARFRAVRLYIRDRKRITKRIIDVMKNAVGRLERSEKYYDVAERFTEDQIEKIKNTEIISDEEVENRVDEACARLQKNGYPWPNEMEEEYGKIVAFVLSTGLTDLRMAMEADADALRDLPDTATAKDLQEPKVRGLLPDRYMNRYDRNFYKKMLETISDVTGKVNLFDYYPESVAEEIILVLASYFGAQEFYSLFEGVDEINYRDCECQLYEWLEDYIDDPEWAKNFYQGDNIVIIAGDDLIEKNYAFEFWFEQ